MQLSQSAQDSLKRYDKIILRTFSLIQGLGIRHTKKFSNTFNSSIHLLPLTNASELLAIHSICILVDNYLGGDPLSPHETLSKVLR